VESKNPEVIGYWENWLDVKWWDNAIPGNCLMGQVKLKQTICH